MGRRLTVSKDAKSVSAKLPPALQVAVHKLIGERWEKTGVRPSQNELFVEALRRFVESEGVSVSQIEDSVSKWEQAKPARKTVTPFPRKSKGR